VANDFANLTALDKKQFEVNLTRGLAYRHGSAWHNDNARYMQAILKDFKVNISALISNKKFVYLKKQDIRIIIGNFNQTIATHMFCHVRFYSFERNLSNNFDYLGSTRENLWISLSMDYPWLSIVISLVV
jgi:hypothetical protein